MPGALFLWMVGTMAFAADRDGDRIEDLSDNCPGTANPHQADADGDGFGRRG